MTATPSSFVPDYSDLLIQLMADNDDEYAALKTLHGSYGKWENFRVILLSSLKLEMRTRPPLAGTTGWTDKLMEAAAHNDPRYRVFVMDGAKQARWFFRLAEQRGEAAALAAGNTFGGIR
jgi:hypothetical protein